MKKMMIILASVFTVVFLVWSGFRISNSLTFYLNCETYLKRAATANTIEMAKPELSKAIEYIEENELTTGIVSIFLKNPLNDIGFWYTNLKASYEELEKIPDDATALEKTNVLMKLRESLTDQSGDSGTVVVIPSGISIYPNNVLYFWWGTLSITGMCVFGTIILGLYAAEANSKAKGNA